MSKKFIPIRYLFVFCFLFFVLFHFFPAIDLKISSLFFENGAWLGQRGWFAIAREFYYKFSLILPLVFFVIVLFHARLALNVPRRIYSFILAYFVCFPIILTNGILKEVWGRARPRNIVEFGGTREFTPVSLFPVDQCETNCSFVSGEASGAAAIMIVLWVIFPRAYWAILIFAPMALMRVMSGAHFTSDVIFAVLFMMIGFEFLRQLVSFEHQDFMNGRAILRDARSLTRSAANGAFSALRYFYTSALHFATVVKEHFTKR